MAKWYEKAGAAHLGPIGYGLTIGVPKGVRNAVRDTPIGTVFGMDSSGQIAARAQQRGLAEAQQQAMPYYTQALEYQKPYMSLGEQAIGQLPELQQMALGYRPSAEFTQQQQFRAPSMADDPGYQFRLAEGEKAINRAAAARGGFGGSGTIRDLARYSSDLASQEYGNAYNRALQGYGLSQQDLARRQALEQSTEGQRYSRYADIISNMLGMGERGAQQYATGTRSIGDLLYGTRTAQAGQEAAGRLAQGQRDQQLWNLGMKGAGAAAGYFLGGPAGAAAGASMMGSGGGSQPAPTSDQYSMYARPDLFGGY
jgi:hypothetical protein